MQHYHLHPSRWTLSCSSSSVMVTSQFCLNFFSPLTLPKDSQKAMSLLRFARYCCWTPSSIFYLSSLRFSAVPPNPSVPLSCLVFHSHPSALLLTGGSGLHVHVFCLLSPCVHRSAAAALERRNTLYAHTHTCAKKKAIRWIKRSIVSLQRNVFRK